MKTYTIAEGLAARVAAYARRKRLTEARAVSALLDAGLRAHERAVGAGKARAAARYGANDQPGAKIRGQV